MKKILAGNWKMFKTRSDVEDFFSHVSNRVAESPVRKIVAASPTLLESAVAHSLETGIEIFSQNCHWETQGAFTGEISPLQLADVGAVGTLIGHSERRQLFQETDESCLKRAFSALNAGLEVIYCVGETIEARKAGQTLQVLEKQLKSVIELKAPREKFILAYEPVWAIGTGLTANSEQIIETHNWIAEILEKNSLNFQILYGGSVKPTNFKEIASLKHVSGGLVGGASLEAESYLQLHDCLMA